MKAICVGVNEYLNFPYAKLNYCVNDARDMVSFFRARGVEDITVLTDSSATMNAVYSNISFAVKTGCGLLLSISSHGTNVKDISGDESDGMDEAFVMYDSTFSRLLTDDMLYGLFRQTDARVEVWLDTCHSGTGVKVLPDSEKSIRYLHNPNCDGLRPKHRTLLAKAQKENNNVVLWSGCKADEYSYEDGISNGVFTRAWLNCFSNYGKSCRSSVSRQVRKTVKLWGFDQTPQLEASFFRKYSKLEIY